jgi:NADPH:quinone reductase-like Zn-dependent oxidoreductase
MKALLYDKYGSTEGLEIREIERPTPKKNEVLVRVHAVSVNDWDLGLVHGQGVNRVIGGLFGPKKIIGSDVAGRVVSVGGEVKRFRAMSRRARPVPNHLQQNRP